MKKPEYHFFICNSYRIGGEAQGSCNKKNGAGLIQYASEQCGDRGLDAIVSSTGCLNVCTEGPVMIVYPQNQWYGNITEEAIDEILDAIEDGGVAEKYLISN
jgi:(2Fe-2S) ferredoxin